MGSSDLSLLSTELDLDNDDYGYPLDSQVKAGWYSKLLFTPKWRYAFTPVWFYMYSPEPIVKCPNLFQTRSNIPDLSCVLSIVSVENIYLIIYIQLSEIFLVLHKYLCSSILHCTLWRCPFLAEAFLDTADDDRKEIELDGTKNSDHTHGENNKTTQIR